MEYYSMLLMVLARSYFQATHSARLTAVNAFGEVTQVESKWGEWGVYQHHPWDVPAGYQSMNGQFASD